MDAGLGNSWSGRDGIDAPICMILHASAWFVGDGVLHYIPDRSCEERKGRGKQERKEKKKRKKKSKRMCELNVSNWTVLYRTHVSGLWRKHVIACIQSKGNRGNKRPLSPYLHQFRKHQTLAILGTSWQPWHLLATLAT